MYGLDPWLIPSPKFLLSIVECRVFTASKRIRSSKFRPESRGETMCDGTNDVQ